MAAIKLTQRISRGPLIAVVRPQYFHLLRRQINQEIVRPLIVMTPKSLLRLPTAASTIDELTNGGFQPVIDDANVKDRSKVTRILLCSGKVFYDLETARQASGEERLAIVRLEQFYPFPTEKLQEIFASYPNAKQLFWVQEEPRNMGGWTFVYQRLDDIKGSLELRYVGRAASASPATGSYVIHGLETEKFISEAMFKGDENEISAASEPAVSEKIAPAGA